MADPSDLPEPDRIPGAPHPRETGRLFGQARAEADFLDAFNSGRLHSGWLLTGPRGIGKATLAWRIALFLLAQPTESGLFAAPPDTLDVSRDHPDARLLLAGAHPRLYLLRRAPNDKGDRISAEIRADQVRALKKFFHMSAADGGRRVVIVDAADEMNVSAANALLKELEEPPALTTLLLVAHRPSRLLPTIRSRCRELRLSSLGPDDIAAALEQAGIDPDGSEAVAALSDGSVGEAIRLIQGDGPGLYAEIIHLLETAPRLDRQRALKLANSVAGRQNEARLDLMLDLLDRLLARIARAGVMGEPQVQAAPGEARLLTQLAPDPYAARGWATLGQALTERSRRGRAVNLDPTGLILDILLKVEDQAREVANRTADQGTP